MSKLMEDRLIEDRMQTAANLLLKDKLSYDEIAEATKLSLSDIEDIARQLNTAEAR